MKTKTAIYHYFLLVFLCAAPTINAQIMPGVYFSVANDTVHELKLSDRYLIHTTYKKSPANFIKTEGGFYQIEDQRLVVLLEFNSNYAKDPIRQLRIPFEKDGNNLILGMKSDMKFKPNAKISQDLDGQWLFGVRGPDEGQERRGDSKSRKTLKFLQDGRFQWIAYNTETMQFHGTGGGSFTSKDGVYQENIEFFSRDNSRVGAELTFEYKINGNDWHHQGKNSKGEPMYEIWMRRNN
ncbi:hypothetical protein HPE56_15780 [Maribacter sp. ANRC-HE7]|uniref:Membrane or secreted protein n=1 Tax=Maribacter aquimaris TaxID=2737171 RepID=A0ABR7V3N3_9FLAO|nr:hypothetical protein [Maribacter aquimaris]MBD0779261.1 hypothetical protein [Maribacter aquimaris]